MVDNGHNGNSCSKDERARNCWPRVEEAGVDGNYIFRTVNRATAEVERVHPPAGQTTTSTSPSDGTWQLPLWTWLAHSRGRAHWRSVTSARARVNRDGAGRAGSWTSGLVSRLRRSQRPLNAVAEKSQDCYLSPVLIAWALPITRREVQRRALTRLGV